MSHLSRDERLLAVDGALEASRAGHLAACGACHAEVEALRHVVDRVRAVDVPEPSPLFWDHLAARVGEAIAQEPRPAPAIAWWSPRLGWAAVAVLITAVGGGYLTRWHRQPSPPIVAHATVTPADPGDATGGDAGLQVDEDAPAADDGWTLIAAVADEGEQDDAFVPQVGQAELSISALSADERAALASELAAELAPRRTQEG
jgi:hypothetical protein